MRYLNSSHRCGRQTALIANTSDSILNKAAGPFRLEEPSPEPALGPNAKRGVSHKHPPEPGAAAAARAGALGAARCLPARRQGLLPPPPRTGLSG